MSAKGKKELARLRRESDIAGKYISQFSLQELIEFWLLAKTGESLPLNDHIPMDNIDELDETLTVLINNTNASKLFPKH